MAVPDQEPEFIQHLTSCQHWLRTYLRALVTDGELADELLQRTNLVLWEKSGDFRSGTNFNAWACRVARFEVMAYRKQQVRDHRVFSNSAFEAIADEAEKHIGVLQDLRGFLDICLKQLPHEQSQLVAVRYASDGSVQESPSEKGDRKTRFRPRCTAFVGRC